MTQPKFKTKIEEIHNSVVNRINTTTDYEVPTIEVVIKDCRYKNNEATHWFDGCTHKIEYYYDNLKNKDPRALEEVALHEVVHALAPNSRHGYKFKRIYTELSDALELVYRDNRHYQANQRKPKPRRTSYIITWKQHDSPGYIFVVGINGKYRKIKIDNPIHLKTIAKIISRHNEGVDKIGVFNQGTKYYEALTTKDKIEFIGKQPNEVFEVRSWRVD